MGYISIKNPDYLFHLFVAEQHQGKKIATKLWQHSKRALGASRYTVLSSFYAIPVYIKLGFTESGPSASRDGIGYQPMEWIKLQQL
ncbi:MAG: GNAT family N-acetyltransferase [Kangiellaceae bacterium]|nr:GNAT family N-acetyltransferase [Kangiellaceae bacterium]